MLKFNLFSILLILFLITTSFSVETGSDDISRTIGLFYSGICVVIILLIIVLLYVFENKFNSIVVLIIGAIITLLVSYYVTANYEINLERSVLIGSGYAGFFFLVITLLIGPLARVFKTRFFVSLIMHRRNLGVLSFILVLIHTFLVLKVTYSWEFLNLYFWNTDGVYTLRQDRHGISIMLGSLAFILFTVLAITSNKTALILLKKHWKTIQRLSYTVFVLSVLHIFLYRNFLPQSKEIQTLFFGLIAIVVILQLSGFVSTLLNTYKNKPQSPPNPPLPTNKI